MINMEGAQFRRREERRHRTRYDKMLGLCFVDEELGQQLSCTALVTIILFTIIFIVFSIGRPTTEFVRFLVAQYLNVCALVISLRCWWIYYCQKRDNACMISIKIVCSSLGFLISLGLSLFTIILMHVVDSAPDQYISPLNFFGTYFIMVCSLTLNIGNCLKLIFLIIIFVRQGNDESTQRRRARSFDERPRLVIEHYMQHHARELDDLGNQPIEDRERRSRRRLILRHLRSRGVQENTINAIRSILEGALARGDIDGPEERVKIYSRIDRVMYDTQKYGDTETCPICCSDFENQHHVKILPECNHVFHEDCIEQWILKARSNCVLCPVCRTDIKDKLDLIDSQKEEAPRDMERAINESEEDDSDIPNLLYQSVNITEEDEE